MSEKDKNVIYNEKGIVEFQLTEDDKKILAEGNFQNYQNPCITATRIYVKSEDRFYVRLKKSNIKGETDTIFITREEMTDNKNHLLIAEKLGSSYGIGIEASSFRKACDILKNNYTDFETVFLENFGEVHYTYEKIGNELQELVDSSLHNGETKISVYEDRLLLISMKKMKAYSGKWGKSLREIKDYLMMLGVVEVSKGEEKNCRYRHDSASQWSMAFRIDRLKDIR